MLNGISIGELLRFLINTIFGKYSFYFAYKLRFYVYKFSAGGQPFT